jgi:hypothetical protein
LIDIMARLGHTTPAAALRYRHASSDAARSSVDKLSDLADGTVTELRQRKGDTA